MSDLDKLDSFKEKADKYIAWIKENTILVGILTTLIPAIFVGGYQAITELNKAKDALAHFNKINDGFGDLQSRVDALQEKVDNLKERVQNQSDTLSKVQEKAGDALIDAREAKVVSESADKNTKAQISAIRAEVQGALDAVKVEMNAVKRATTNRLGN